MNGLNINNPTSNCYNKGATTKEKQLTAHEDAIIKGSDVATSNSPMCGSIDSSKDIKNIIREILTGSSSNYQSN